MLWVYWLVGILWVLDGFMFFVFPAAVRNLIVRAFREERILTASAGPALVAVLLAAASFGAPHPWALRLLALLSAAQAVYFFRAIRTTSPRPIERLIALPNRAYRAWGLFLTLLGPVLIALRP
jgi:uncharacterized protein YjeT (DUF2065 family)